MVKGSAENVHLRNNEAEGVYEPLHIRILDNCETDTVITSRLPLERKPRIGQLPLCNLKGTRK